MKTRLTKIPVEEIKFTSSIVLMKCPRQKNLWDCGIYVLENIEIFYNMPFADDQDMKDLFNPQQASKMRREIHAAVKDHLETEELFASSQAIEY